MGKIYIYLLHYYHLGGLFLLRSTKITTVNLGVSAVILNYYTRFTCVSLIFAVLHGSLLIFVYYIAKNYLSLLITKGNSNKSTFR